MFINRRFFEFVFYGCVSIVGEVVVEIIRFSVCLNKIEMGLKKAPVGFYCNEWKMQKSESLDIPGQVSFIYETFVLT